MARPLQKKQLERLAAVCGMFNSGFVGERAAAAALADRIVRGNGLRWNDVIVPAVVPAPIGGNSTSVAEQIARALRSTVINSWEHEFLISISGRQHLTPKQENKLAQIHQKVRAYEKARGGP